MTQLTIIEKFAIVTILSQIMNADGVIHPNEEEYMDKVYAELGITISDMEDITNMDTTQAKSIINAMLDEKKQYAKFLFISMAKTDGYIHPLEKEIIDKLWTV
ncbi:MAG: TerB family tellurite resistance protein [Alphaproteobacteria bacterium]|nr:TerB family tellurite resistance protein [Alphaproteobacteria bacterium]